MECVMLIVKGGEEAATDAAERHGFEVVSILPGPRSKAETTIHALGRIGLAAEWLCEPGEVPYPAGSLLYYAERG